MENRKCNDNEVEGSIPTNFTGEKGTLTTSWCFSTALRDWQRLGLHHSIHDWFHETYDTNHDIHAAKKLIPLWDFSSATTSSTFDCISFRLLTPCIRQEGRILKSNSQFSCQLATTLPSTTSQAVINDVHQDDDDYNQLGVAFDPESKLLLEHSNACFLSGQLDILLHPTYSLPCPYIRLWEANGRLLSCEEIASILGLSDKGDEIIAEEHPLKKTPHFVLHICGIGERLQVMDEIDKGQRAEELSLSSSLSYFIKWLALVGPKIGIPLPPNLFQHILMITQNN